jgi:hypothetical protein
MMDGVAATTGSLELNTADDHVRQTVGKRKAVKTMHINVSPIFDDPLQDDTSANDYSEIFIDQMNGLYLLSFLVTADREVAERCFSKALDEYVEARGGFLEWAKQDGRCAVLRHAVQIIRPAPKQAYAWSFYGNARPLMSAAHQPFVAITSLSAFERFVFVMSVIEGLSQEECAALLNCSIEDVAIGRELAGMIIATEDLSCDQMGEMNPLFVPGLLGHQRRGIC